MGVTLPRQVGLGGEKVGVSGETSGCSAAALDPSSPREVAGQGPVGEGANRVVLPGGQSLTCVRTKRCELASQGAPPPSASHNGCYVPVGGHSPREIAHESWTLPEDGAQTHSLGRLTSPVFCHLLVGRVAQPKRWSQRGTPPRPSALSSLTPGWPRNQWPLPPVESETPPAL